MIDLEAELKALESYNAGTNTKARNNIRAEFKRIASLEAEVAALEKEIRRLAEAGARARVRIAELEAAAAAPMPFAPTLPPGWSVPQDPMPQYGMNDFPHRPWTTASSLPLAQDDPPIAWDDEEFPGEGCRNAQFTD